MELSMKLQMPAYPNMFIICVVRAHVLAGVTLRYRASLQKIEPQSVLVEGEFFVADARQHQLLNSSINSEWSNAQQLCLSSVVGGDVATLTFGVMNPYRKHCGEYRCVVESDTHQLLGNSSFFVRSFPFCMECYSLS